MKDKNGEITTEKLIPDAFNEYHVQIGEKLRVKFFCRVFLRIFSLVMLTIQIRDAGSYSGQRVQFVKKRAYFFQKGHASF